MKGRSLVQPLALNPLGWTAKPVEQKSRGGAGAEDLKRLKGEGK
jgi:hypothetical protein